MVNRFYYIILQYKIVTSHLPPPLLSSPGPASGEHKYCLLPPPDVSAARTRLQRQLLFATSARLAGDHREGYPKVRDDFTITEKAATRAFSWLIAPSAFTFKTLLRHYTKQALTP